MFNRPQLRKLLKRLKRPIESYNKTWLGMIGLTVIALLLGGVVLFGSLNVGTTRYQGEFAQSAQINKGNQVTIAGIQVGTVEGVKLAGDHVVVTFNVKNGTHLGADTQASINMTTILGSRYLALTPAGSGELKDRTIRLANTEVPFDLQRTLAGATSTFEAVDADRVVESVRSLTQNLQGLPDALPEALENLQSLATVISDRRDQLGTLLSNTETLTTMLRNQKADLGVLVLQGRDLLAEIATRRAAVQRLFASATTLVDRAKTILADEPELNKLLANAREFTAMINSHDALVRNILQSMPITVRNLANTTGNGNYLDLNLPAGVLVDSWMCAISGRARQFNLVEYFKDCQ
ncbi:MULTISPECIES: MCE family protein [Mycobacterium]|uniref:Mce family protein n=1 Tax=Mycobacterium kiyosense TaxID=2871094 RepID=A0A9P3UV20_9MYCO|nr:MULTISPECIES: MCE family protein [Mycobacterium]BDE16171.1 putative Mce family protein [Mycobacterium sp. 20KCMC460]GLB82158.1 putative Mce family protein [Mycobacterium kiyosense]GLB90551.1 putative Mce family protein [Mycobacterium kiyosense]GLB95300.1 putative Mce family protein [Mycobacterium kiyosense]GLC00227.1 putative Mce family protein [Mycobacterium kiyosense]